MTIPQAVVSSPLTRSKMREFPRKTGRICKTPPVVLPTPNRGLTHSLDTTKEGLAMNATQTCSIAGCSRPHFGKTWCSKHYKRWWRNGHPEKLQRFPDPEQAFAARTVIVGNCLVWTGVKDTWGYGQLKVNGKMVRAHRYAWERALGPIPAGMFVDHRFHCDPGCVTVAHLRLATHAQNQANRPGPNRGSTSGVRNVRRYGNRWQVEVQKDGEKHHFGTFDDLETASVVAEEARRELFGEFAGRGKRPSARIAEGENK